MGAYSTVDIKRKDAKRAIHAVLDDLTDEQLSSVLFAAYRDTVIHNYNIVENDEESTMKASELIRSVEWENENF